MAGCGLVDDPDHLLEEQIFEVMAGYAIVADELWSMMARPPVLEFPVHAAGAAIIALSTVMISSASWIVPPGRRQPDTGAVAAGDRPSSRSCAAAS